ncbi:Protein of unknown function [Soonwooa buanensis]|uniref:Lysozyme inhibitor LprI-like N-terminal domain-containing protein n=1 Tax=Soonwooa buanensis TaxID=619805 RepID=A0A1T5G5X5_9FLAO|nr:lysozyme inhibitor LprI family protein [Soonwooa buanensis]SKC03893.1 Protein of unknown function [Soonwooa buanensis]
MKKYIFAYATFFILFTYQSMNAQENNIETELEKCLEKNYSTAGQRECTFKAQESYDKDLNKYYQLTLKRLPNAQEIQFTSAQKAWLKFRDAEFSLIDGYYYNVKQGTLYSVIAAGEKLNVVKVRAKQLQVYYEMLDQ